MLNVGIAGVGGLGKVHLGGLLKLAARARVAALADPIPGRRSGQNLTSPDLNIALNNRQPVSVQNIRSYPDYSELCVDQELDAVVIAMPTDLHAPGAILALENGKHVFAEKPMALNSADCRRMLDAARANRRILMVGQVLRFWPAYLEAKRLMDCGHYGKTLAAGMRRYGARPQSGWFTEHARSGGVKLDLHIHDVDAALWWWGRPAQVHALTVGSAEAVSGILSQWQYRDGPVVNMEALWDVGTPFNADFRIVMEQATLEYNMAGSQGLLLRTRDGVAAVPSDRPDLSAYDEELSYFLECVENRKPVSRCPPEDSALAVQHCTV